MTLLATILTEAEPLHPLIMPPIGYAIVAASTFVTLGIITWSYRDVANRHRVKLGQGSPDSHTTGH